MPTKPSLLFFSFLVFTSSLLFSCKKDNALEQRVAQLETRVSDIENKLSKINLDITNLQEQGKLTLDEVKSLQALTANLSAFINDVKTTGITNSIEINNLKASLQQTVTIVQFDDLKKTLAQLTNIINNISVQQQASDQTINSLQSAITQIAADLNNLKAENTLEITGKIENGAFAKGSMISLYEMDSSLRQTGRSFNTTVTDNLGSFTLKVKNLNGKICRVVTDGFYYNEVEGAVSTSKITLTGITKVDSSEKMNINVLTHLERPRVEYLMLNGKSFDDAKAQAVSEVLKIFGIVNSGIKKSEKIDLIGTATKNNILLAISTMLVGFRSENKLTEIMNDIAEDLKVDGKLDNTTVGDDIETHLYYLDTASVIRHVKSKYTSAYPDSVLNKIDLSYINIFQKATNYSKSYELIEYPKELNLLNYKNALVESVIGGSADYNGLFGIVAKLPSAALSLRIDVTIQDYNDPSIFDNIGYSENSNWNIKLTNDFKSITLKSNGSGLQSMMLSVDPYKKERIIIKLYENGATSPTRTKVVISYPRQ